MPVSIKRLPKRTHDAFEEFIQEGNHALDAGESAEALEAFGKALALIPEPTDEYEATFEVLGAIGDTHFFDDQFEEGLKSFEEAQRVFGQMHGHYQPFLMLRIGQCLYAMSDEDPELRTRGHAMLSKVLEVVGEEIFEQEDPEFLDFARSSES